MSQTGAPSLYLSDRPAARLSLYAIEEMTERKLLVLNLEA
jgi:hypothetical protein